MDKPRLIEIKDLELSQIRAAQGALDVPYTFSNRVGSRIHFWADADELRKWRASQSTFAEEQK